MPKQDSYEEFYRQPFGGHRHPKGLKPLVPSPANRALLPYGHARKAHLPSLAVGLGRPDLERRAVPLSTHPDLTVLERIFLRELLIRHLVEGVDFGIQVKFEGGHTVVGGYASDFLIYYPWHKGVEVQGEVWHAGIVDAVVDQMKEIYLKSIGIPDISYIREDEISDPYRTAAWFRRELNL